MASQPIQPRVHQCSPSRNSQQFGGISLIRTQMLAANALLSTSQDPLPTDRNPTPVAATSDYAPQAPKSDPPTNPYYGVPPRGGGSIRNPNNPCDFLPNTQVVVRGGFSTIPRDVSDGDPDPKFLGPHYPPMSNDFYELTSDGRLSEVYFENARIRRFRANPGLSILAAELSPATSDAGDEAVPVEPVPVQQDRIYIGQGYWRQANEKVSPMQENKPLYRHKYAQEPTKIGVQNRQQAWCGEPRTNEEFWRASEMMDSDDASQELEMDRPTHHTVPQITTQEESQSSPRKLLQQSIHRSAESDNKDDEKPKRTQSEADIRKGRDTLFERILVQHTARPVLEDTKQNQQEPQKDEGIYSVRQSLIKDRVTSNVHPLQQEVLTEEFPPYASHDANSPGDLYSDDSSMVRTKRDLESMFPPVPTGEGTTTRKNVSFQVMDSSDSGRS